MTQHISLHAVLRKRLHDQAGLLHRRRDFDLAKLAETKWAETFWQATLSYIDRRYLRGYAEAVKLFETYMRNRLMMGAFRYGTFHEQRDLGRRHDNIPSVCRRWKRYQRTGNQELLVDCANLCMVEYIAPGSHPSPVGDCRRRVVCLGVEGALARYMQEGVVGCLPAAASGCLIEFCTPFIHPSPHWSPEDDGEHVSTARTH